METEGDYASELGEVEERIKAVRVLEDLFDELVPDRAKRAYVSTNHI